ncbi:hypothetical protein F2P81_012235 [Scophthalmus maximus]|uniref:Uncharacterized protein n=1 Tax=Scophthalmus maximus TaxID=52904 RepID=A0A6A4SMS0_SCOMX|nr:hypothetical protein F2P81_012235 [Scophthalmus maximus]
MLPNIVSHDGMEAQKAALVASLIRPQQSQVIPVAIRHPLKDTTGLQYRTTTNYWITKTVSQFRGYLLQRLHLKTDCKSQRIRCAAVTVRNFNSVLQCDSVMGGTQCVCKVKKKPKVGGVCCCSPSLRHDATPRCAALRCAALRCDRGAQLLRDITRINCDCLLEGDSIRLFGQMMQLKHEVRLRGSELQCPLRPGDVVHVHFAHGCQVVKSHDHTSVQLL